MFLRALRLIVVAATLTATALGFASCDEEEEGESCCSCRCFHVAICNPEMVFRRYGNDLDCDAICYNQCDLNQCELLGVDICSEDQ